MPCIPPRSTTHKRLIPNESARIKHGHTHPFPVFRPRHSSRSEPKSARRSAFHSTLSCPAPSAPAGHKSPHDTIRPAPSARSRIPNPAPPCSAILPAPPRIQAQKKVSRKFGTPLSFGSDPYYSTRTTTERLASCVSNGLSSEPLLWIFSISGFTPFLIR